MYFANQARPTAVRWRSVYRSAIPAEWRYWLYGLRHPMAMRQLRTVVHPSPKGNFSLRGFDERRAIFVHIPKAAGTSVALSLFGELPYHYTAGHYRVIFGRRTYRRYFKFAFVRNPWDRLYSAYHYLRAGGWNDADKAWAEANLARFTSFDQFVLEWLTRERLASYMHFHTQASFICDWRGRPIIDHLGYFETLEEDFRLIAARLGVDAALGHVNRSDRKDYRAAYSSAAMERVAEVYREDIEAFGYDFDGIHHRKRVLNGAFVPV